MNAPQPAVSVLLDVLAANGARAFDPAGFHLVESLLRRADALSGTAGHRLRERAAARAAALSSDLTTAQQRAATTALAAQATVATRQRAQLARAEATQRALAAKERYEHVRDSLMAAIEIARAADTVSELSGPYNPLLLAARALAELADLAPSYVHAQINRLEDLGALLALPPERPVRSRRARK